MQVVRALFGRDELLTDEAGKRGWPLWRFSRLERSRCLKGFGGLRRFRNVEKLELGRSLWLSDISRQIYRTILS